MVFFLLKPALGSIVKEPSGKTIGLLVFPLESASSNTAMFISRMGIRNTISSVLLQYLVFLNQHSIGQYVSNRYVILFRHTTLVLIRLTLHEDDYDSAFNNNSNRVLKCDVIKIKFLKLWECQDILKEQCPRGLLAKNEHFGANCL